MPDEDRDYQAWKHGREMAKDGATEQRFHRREISEKDLWPEEKQRMLRDWDWWHSDWK